MTDAEVALEIMKIILQSERTTFSHTEKRREYVLALYAECVNAVRAKGTN